MRRSYATQHSPWMALISRMTFLHRRRGSQNWYARMMVPAALRGAIGKREFIKSLGTTNKAEAEVLALPLIAEWKRNVRALSLEAANDLGIEQPYPARRPTMAEMEEAALHHGYEQASAKLNALLARKAKLGPEAFRLARETFGLRYAAASRQFLAGDHSYWEDRARAIVTRRNWMVGEDSPEFHALVTNLAKCGIDLFRRAVSILDDPCTEIVPSTSTKELSKRVKERAKHGEGILDLYDRYAAQRRSEGKKRDDTLNQDRKAVEGFVAFIGSERSLSSVQVKEVRDWRNTMALLPAAYTKQNAYAGMSMKEAAAHAQRLGAKPVSPVTVNKNLSALSALYAWAKREGYTEANPCDGLHYDIKKRQNPRPPFDSAQLNKILKSPLFTGFERDGREYKKGDQQTRDWRFWLPLVCLFTGARIGEIAQLWVDDLGYQDGAPFIHIRHDESRGQRTKSGYSRYAPVHSKLQQIGFLDFVSKQRQRANRTGEFKLFPELFVDDRAQNGRASRFWRTYLERIGIKRGGDGFGSHSFRHGLADQLRLAGFFDQDIAVVLGHNQATVTSGYGKLRQGTVAKLSEIIETADFKGVSFKHLL